MPPVVELDDLGITSWEDYEYGVKRGAMLFHGDNALTFSYGNTGTTLRLANVADPALDSGTCPCASGR